MILRTMLLAGLVLALPLCAADKPAKPGKWVKILGWEGPEAAAQEIMEGIANYAKSGGV